MINNAKEILIRVIKRVKKESELSSGMNPGSSYYAAGYRDAMKIVELIITQELKMASLTQLTIEEVLKNENT